MELPPQFSHVHDVFHVSQLRRCFKDPEHEVDLELIEVQDDLTYKEHPIRILEEAERRTYQKITRFLKVHWSKHTEEEVTWEREDHLHDE